MAKPVHNGYFVASQEFLSVAQLLCFIAWGVYCTLAWAPHEETFVIQALFLFSPLVLVPRLLAVLRAISNGVGRKILTTVQVLYLPSVLLLAVAYLRDPHPLAAAMAVPWGATTLLLAAWGVSAIIRSRNWRRPDRWCIGAGAVYGLVGGGWALFDRLGYAPLGFDPLIVLLTAMHFHHVGLVVPAVAGLAAERFARPAGYIAGLGVVLGVPLVAGGITVTHTTGNPILEAAAVTVMTGGLLGLAYVLFALVGDVRVPSFSRFTFMIASLACATGAILALLYGLRAYVVIPSLTVATMAKTHGLVNAFLFELPAVAGWMRWLGQDGATTAHEDVEQFL